MSGQLDNVLSQAVGKDVLLILFRALQEGSEAYEYLRSIFNYHHGRKIIV